MCDSIIHRIIGAGNSINRNRQRGLQRNIPLFKGCNDRAINRAGLVYRKDRFLNFVMQVLNPARLKQSSLERGFFVIEEYRLNIVKYKK